MYNYECSSDVLQAYVPVFFITAIWDGFISPLGVVAARVLVDKMYGAEREEDEDDLPSQFFGENSSSSGGAGEGGEGLRGGSKRQSLSKGSGSGKSKPWPQWYVRVHTSPSSNISSNTPSHSPHSN